MERTKSDKLAISLARLLIGGFFMLEGLSKLANTDSAVNVLGSYGIPAAGLLAVLFALFEILFGFMIAMRYHTRTASLLLAIYVAISAVVLHFSGAIESHSIARTFLYKDLAIIGGLLFIHGHSKGYFLLATNFRDKRKRPQDHHSPPMPPQ